MSHNDDSIKEWTQRIKSLTSELNKLKHLLADAYYHRGAAYQNKEDIHNAFADYRKVIEFDCDYISPAQKHFIDRDFDAVIADSTQTIKWTHCRCQNNGKISKIIESHRHSFSRNRPQPALHNRDSGEVVGDYRNGYNELIHRKELVPWGTVSDKHLHT